MCTCNIAALFLVSLVDVVGLGFFHCDHWSENYCFVRIVTLCKIQDQTLHLVFV